MGCSVQVAAPAIFVNADGILIANDLIACKVCRIGVSVGVHRTACRETAYGIEGESKAVPDLEIKDVWILGTRGSTRANRPWTEREHLSRHGDGSVRRDLELHSSVARQVQVPARINREDPAARQSECSISGDVSLCGQRTARAHISTDARITGRA